MIIDIVVMVLLCSLTLFFSVFAMLTIAETIAKLFGEHNQPTTATDYQKTLWPEIYGED